MVTSDQDRVVAELLERYGQTFSEETGIRLADKPAPLYQLHVLSTLLSARISGDIAMAAARELFTAGYRTPAAMSSATWRLSDTRTSAAASLARRWSPRRRCAHGWP